MGAFAEPGQQPWRGIGNLNLTRFDRTKAIELVQQWSEALENLRDRAEALTRSSGWPRPESLGDLARTSAAVREIPDPPPRLDERVLAHAADENFRRSLASWANHALSAEQYCTFIARIADRAKLEATLDVGARAAAKAKELGVLDATPKELKDFVDLAQAEARERAAVVELIADVLAAVGRDLKREIDFKAEAMVAGYLHHVAALPGERYRWRSNHLDQDGCIEALMEADATAGEARNAAAEARFEDPPTPHFAESLPSVSELRQAAGTLRGAGVWSGLGANGGPRRRPGAKPFLRSGRWFALKPRAGFCRPLSGRKKWRS
jgi:hypothetical protein